MVEKSVAMKEVTDSIAEYDESENPSDIKSKFLRK